VSDVTFSKNGRYVFSRDFLTCKIWDINMPTKPISSIQIFEPLKSKLSEMYENECIFDKFDLNSSCDSNQVVVADHHRELQLDLPPDRPQLREQLPVRAQLQEEDRG
jgi:serine/threonine-protein phosphatase 2A regulatory subunit B